MGANYFYTAFLLWLYFRKYLVTMIHNGGELKWGMVGKEAMTI